MSTWKGQNIKQMRPAHDGDQGFDKSKGQDQVIITLQDGSERCVPRSELQG